MSVLGHLPGPVSCQEARTAFFSSPTGKVHNPELSRTDSQMYCTFPPAAGQFVWCRHRASFVLAMSGRPSSRAKEPARLYQLFKFRADKAYTVPGEYTPRLLDEPTLAFPAAHCLPHYLVLVSVCDAEPLISGIVRSVIQDSRSLSCQDHLRILIRGKIKNSHSI